MATFLVKPSSASYSLSPLNAGGDRFQAALFGRIVFPWDQVQTLQGAMLGMHERAAEGVAEGTNRAAARAREHIVNAIANAITVHREEIDKSVYVSAKATEEKPAAKISVGKRPFQLIKFEGVHQDELGTYARVYRDQPDRFTKSAFVQQMPDGRTGVFTRKRIGGDVRVGRYPITELYGPSSTGVLQDRPELLIREEEAARTALIEEISEVRNEIVDDFQKHPSAFSQAFPKAADFISDVLILPKIFARFIR